MNKNNYTTNYYLKRVSEIENKMDQHLNDALVSAYGGILSCSTKSEFPLFFIGFTLLSVIQLDYYLLKRNHCYEKMHNEVGMTEPIKLKKVIEYRKR